MQLQSLLPRHKGEQDADEVQWNPPLGSAWSGAARWRWLVPWKRPQMHQSLRLPAFVSGSFNTGAGEVLPFLCVSPVD